MERVLVYLKLNTRKMLSMHKKKFAMTVTKILKLYKPEKRLFELLIKFLNLQRASVECWLESG